MITLLLILLIGISFYSVSSDQKQHIGEAMAALGAIRQHESGHKNLPIHHQHVKVKSKAHNCGGWQKEYTDMHKDTMQNLSKRSRLFIFKSPNSGLTDRLVGLITGFYAAVLSKRAFLISDWWTYPRDTQVQLTSALDNHYINLSLPASYEKRLRLDNTSYIHLDYINKEPLFSLKDNEKEAAKGVRAVFSKDDGDAVVLFESNRGGTYSLFKNSTGPANGLGVIPNAGIYCAFHYLFKPNSQVLELMHPLSTVLRDENVIKIGIQIRTGDHGFSFKSSAKISDKAYYRNFFECAQSIEDSVNASQRRVVWYLISDSVSLKSSAVETYGNKLLADIEHVPMHIGINNDVNNLQSGGPLAMQLAVADVLQMALCDYFVVSHDSGLGKLGVLLSHSAHFSRVYVVDEYRCKPADDDQIARSNQGF